MQNVVIVLVTTHQINKMKRSTDIHGNVGQGKDLPQFLTHMHTINM